MSDSERSLSSQRSQQKQIFYVKLVLNEELTEVWNNQQQIENLKKEKQLLQFYIDDKLEERYQKEKIKVLIIQQQDNDELLSQFKEVLEKTQLKEMDIKILVPENYISVIIGKQGRQIKRIKEDTKVNMIIGQPDRLKFHREIELKGKISYIVRALREINEIMSIKEKEDKQNQIKIKKLSDKYDQVETKLRLPMNQEISSEINLKLIKKIESKRPVKIIVYEDSYKKVKCLSENENVVEIKGQLKYIKEVLEYLIKKLCKDKNVKQEIQNKRIKMLIPNSYVTKMIGSKGQMIREMAQLSGGASIRIQSNKMMEKNQKECMIIINGSITNKILAVQNLTHQLEHLKQQFKQEQTNNNNHNQKINDKGSNNYSRSSSSNSSSNSSNSIRSRSRSRSKSKSNHRPFKQQSSRSRSSSNHQTSSKAVKIIVPYSTDLSYLTKDLPSLVQSQKKQQIWIKNEEFKILELEGNIQDQVEVFRRVMGFYQKL